VKGQVRLGLIVPTIPLAREVPVILNLRVIVREVSVRFGRCFRSVVHARILQPVPPVLQGTISRIPRARNYNGLISNTSAIVRRVPRRFPAIHGRPVVLRDAGRVVFNPNRARVRFPVRHWFVTFRPFNIANRSGRPIRGRTTRPERPERCIQRGVARVIDNSHASGLGQFSFCECRRVGRGCLPAAPRPAEARAFTFRTPGTVRRTGGW
jgi:hypothetical protein